jgi:hypothetical protein
MGGDIAVQSAVGVGSTFVVTLPQRLTSVVSTRRMAAETAVRTRVHGDAKAGVETR